MHAIDGIPSNCQILHVEQEVVGDDISALQCVLNSDIERTQLLQEESCLLARQVNLYFSELLFVCYLVLVLLRFFFLVGLMFLCPLFGLIIHY